MKQLPVFLFALFIAGSLFAQPKNFIVKLSGDTVFGRTIKLTGKHFAVDAANETILINADDVSKINIHDKVEVVLHCVLQLYTDDLGTLERGWVNLASADTVLYLQEIYSTPKMNLYHATDNMKSQYYFYKTPADSLPIQLVVRYHIGGGFSTYGNNPGAGRGDLSRTHLEEDKGYINQLRAIMKDCSKIPEVMWEIVSYRDFSLKQLIKKFNRCK